MLERAREGDRFGMAAIELGFVAPEQVYKFLARQVEEVVFAVLMATDGAYCFLEGFDESRLASRQVISVTALLMTYVTRIDEIRHFRPWIPSPEYVPLRLGPRGSAPADGPVWLAIDGRTSIEDIGRATGLGEFEVTKQLFALVQANRVTIQPPPLRGGVHEVVALANTALRAIHLAVDAGGRGTVLRNNLAAFARGEYEALLAGAGPFEHGGLSAPPLVSNSAGLRGPDEVDEYVREMLYDYVSFALFSGSASLGPGCGLAGEVEPLLIKLRPSGQSGLYAVGVATRSSRSPP